ncbi:photoreceptor cell maintenance [Homalodisca vitripennis]|nr:photoreceptor cell maintenance [Homalodisca vitripennis]
MTDYNSSTCTSKINERFLLALKYKHVALIIPYISDTGDRPPESCVFAMFVSICSVVLGLSIFIRHLQINQHLSDEKTDRIRGLWNNVSSGFGGASAFGLLLVANFQEDNDYPVHYTGAAMCIWGGSIYFVFQTFISYLMREHLTSVYLLYGRVVLASFAVLFNMIGLVSTVAAIQHAPQGMPQNTTVSDWSPTDSYWLVHVLSVTSEWSLAFLLSVIVLTFVPELKRMKVVFPRLKIENISPEDE